MIKIVGGGTTCCCYSFSSSDYLGDRMCLEDRDLSLLIYSFKLFRCSEGEAGGAPA